MSQNKYLTFAINNQSESCQDINLLNHHNSDLVNVKILENEKYDQLHNVINHTGFLCNKIRIISNDFSFFKKPIIFRKSNIFGESLTRSILPLFFFSEFNLQRNQIDIDLGFYIKGDMELDLCLPAKSSISIIMECSVDAKIFNCHDTNFCKDSNIDRFGFVTLNNTSETEKTLNIFDTSSLDQKEINYNGLSIKYTELLFNFSRIYSEQTENFSQIVKVGNRSWDLEKYNREANPQKDIISDHILISSKEDFEIKIAPCSEIIVMLKFAK
jgi:hypothetical protein